MKVIEMGNNLDYPTSLKIEYHNAFIFYQKCDREIKRRKLPDDTVFTVKYGYTVKNGEVYEQENREVTLQMLLNEMLLLEQAVNKVTKKKRKKRTTYVTDATVQKVQKAIATC